MNALDSLVNNTKRVSFYQYFRCKDFAGTRFVNQSIARVAFFVHCPLLVMGSPPCFASRFFRTIQFR